MSNAAHPRQAYEIIDGPAASGLKWPRPAWRHDLTAAEVADRGGHGPVWARPGD